MVALHFGNSLIGADAARFGAIQTLIALEDPVLGFYWLYSGAQSEGTITRTRLIEGQPMANPEVTHVAGTTQVYRSSDMILRETAGDVELWVAGTNVSTLISFDIIKEGRLNGQTNFEAQDPIRGQRTAKNRCHRRYAENCSRLDRGSGADHEYERDLLDRWLRVG